MWKLINYITFASIILLILQNYTITVKEYDVLESDIRIVHITDLHTRSFGNDNYGLIRKIRQLEPDVIAITGDLVDGNNVDYIYIINTVKQLSNLAPVMFVLGNNDMWTGKVNKIIEAVEIGGGIFLDNEYITIKGVDFIGHNPYYKNDKIFTSINKIKDTTNELVFLTHQPEKSQYYIKYNVDLFLSGHTHGGQIRIPFIGALIVPDQGFNPMYDKGLYYIGNSVLIVSSGLGNSIIPFRIFNTPEIVLIT